MSNNVKGTKDKRKPSTNFDLSKNDPKPKKTKEDFENSLTTAVQNYLLKYETERKNTREDIEIASGVGGEELDGFIADISQNYENTVKDSKEEKKQKIKTDFLLRPVSEKIEYEDDSD